MQPHRHVRPRSSGRGPPLGCCRRIAHPADGAACPSRALIFGIIRSCVQSCTSFRVRTLISGGPPTRRYPGDQHCDRHKHRSRHGWLGVVAPWDAAPPHPKERLAPPCPVTESSRQNRDGPVAGLRGSDCPLRPAKQRAVQGVGRRGVVGARRAESTPRRAG